MAEALFCENMAPGVKNPVTYPIPMISPRNKRDNSPNIALVLNAVEL